NFSKAEIMEEADPIGPNQKALGVVMLSPLAVSRRDKKKGRRWYNNLENLDLSAALNHRLSRLSGRNVNLRADPDRLYLRINPEYDALVHTRESKKGRTFVIGMRIPLVLQGDEKDLRLAWHAGIGEKTRYGFGCIGLAEKGVGR
ncbi:MAG: CRISPR-associated protein Cas6, partial [bacterium]|nr:CRISPR-associated protein Cas6 [bacterium]